VNTYREMTHGEVDLVKLDKLASTNRLIKEKQLSEMKNQARKAGNMFSFVNDAKTSLIAEMLQQKGYGAQATKTAMERIVDNCDKFPSFKDILTLVKASTPKRDLPTEDKEQRACDKRFEANKAEFVKLLGEDKLHDFCRWYVRNVYGKGCVFEEWGINPKVFLKNALQDWKDAGSTNNFDRIIEVAHKKLEKIKKEKL